MRAALRALARCYLAEGLAWVTDRVGSWRVQHGLLTAEERAQWARLERAISESQAAHRATRITSRHLGEA